jgi:hypothetical protein
MNKNWRIFKKPEVITYKGVKELLDYVRGEGGGENYDFISTEDFKKDNIIDNITAAVVAYRFKPTEAKAIMNKYDNMPYYKMPLYDKILKDTIDAYNAGKKYVNDKYNFPIPNIEKIYNIIPKRHNMGSWTPLNELNETIVMEVSAHIVRELKELIPEDAPRKNGVLIHPRDYPIKKNIRPKVEMDKEKKPRKPRAKKEMKIPAIMSAASLISPVERAAIKALQKKEVDKAENKSASTLQRAMRSRIARKTVAKARMEMMPAPAPVDTQPTPKKERKPRVAKAPRAAKPVYKMSYSAALKAWNASRGNAMYCNPRKGTDEYKAVQALRM